MIDASDVDVFPPKTIGFNVYDDASGTPRLVFRIVNVDLPDGPRLLDADGNVLDVPRDEVDQIVEDLKSLGGPTPWDRAPDALLRMRQATAAPAASLIRMGNAVSGKTTAGLRDVIENELRGAMHVTEFGQGLLKVLPEGAIPTRPFMDRPFMAPGPIRVDAAKREARLRHKDRQKAKKRAARTEQLAKRARRKKGRR